MRFLVGVVVAVSAAVCVACGDDAADAPSAESVFLDRFGSEVYHHPLSADGERRALAYAEVTCAALEEGESKGLLNPAYVSTFVDIQQVKVPDMDRGALVRAVQLSVEFRCPQFKDVVATR